MKRITAILLCLLLMLPVSCAYETTKDAETDNTEMTGTTENEIDTDTEGTENETEETQTMNTESTEMTETETKTATETETESETEFPNAPVTLRVGTFNIQNGAGVGHNFRILAEDILSAGLDIVGLQEVDLNTSRNKNQDTMKKLSEYTGYTYYEYAPNIDFSGGKYGTGILSKYPILSYETVLMPSGGGEQRSYGHAVIEVQGVQIDFYNTHLSWTETSARSQQMRLIGREVSGKDLFILTGDFNTDLSTQYLRFMPDGTVGANTDFNSCPGYGRFDNVVVCPKMSLSNQTMVDGNTHSDHFMVYADVTVNAK